MTPRPTVGTAVSEVYGLLRYAARHRRPVTATYDGEPRLLCPHVGGRKSGRWHLFCYLLAVSSNSAEALAPGGGAGWRCLIEENLSQVELHEGDWHRDACSPLQHC